MKCIFDNHFEADWMFHLMCSMISQVFSWLIIEQSQFNEHQNIIISNCFKHFLTMGNDEFSEYYIIQYYTVLFVCCFRCYLVVQWQNVCDKKKSYNWTHQWIKKTVESSMARASNCLTFWICLSSFLCDGFVCK